MSKINTVTADNNLFIYFNRPEKRNALDAESWDLLANALLEADTNDSILTATLKGDQSSFCSGVDIASMLSGDANEYEKPFNKFIQVLREFSKPLLAIVEGPAVGGGATILLHCDAVFMGTAAKIKYPFSELGLVTELGSSALLLNSLGYLKTFELLAKSDWINAEQYHALGLANYVGIDFENEHAKFVESLSMKSIASIKEIKHILKSLTKESLSKALELETQGMKKLFGSPDNLQAAKEFKK